MDKESKEACSAEFQDAALDLYQLHVDLEVENTKGAEWFEALAALAYLMGEDIRDHKPLDIKDVEKQRAVDAYAKLARAFFKWRNDLMELKHYDKLEAMAGLVTDVWQAMPGHQKLRTLFPPDLWPDHPENKGESDAKQGSQTTTNPG